jgi:hypothetical protein
VAEADPEPETTPEVPPPATDPFAPPQTITEEPSSFDWTDYLAWGLLGTGGLALLAGGGLHYMAYGKVSDANDLDANDPSYDADFDAAYSDASSYMLYSYIAYAVGTVGLLAGLDVLLDWPFPLGGSNPDQPSLSVGPIGAAEGLGCHFSLEFPWN